MELKGLVVVRGAGDIASGIICRLQRCGFRLLVLETAQPTAIRRTVSFSEAVYEGYQRVENITAERINGLKECQESWQKGRVPVLVDPDGCCLQELKPLVLVDCILAKKNLGTNMAMSDITIGIGPGFCAGEDVHVVIETARGHNLGRVIFSGSAAPDSGVPGAIAGFARERVVYAPQDGTLAIINDIGQLVHRGDLLAKIDNVPLIAPIDGIVRGMIRDTFKVRKELKIADIDPREKELENCFTISDKARCISGGVLEAIMHMTLREGNGN